MPQTLLIDETVINQYRTISSSVNEAKRITPFVYEAQVFDLKPLMGAALFDDCCINKTVAPYVDLIAGTQYTDSNGHAVIFEGIGAALAYFAYARFLENQQITITAFGVVQKETPYSSNVDARVLQQRTTQARSGALAYWMQAAKYLTDMNAAAPGTFPLWLYDAPKTKSSGAKISAVDSFSRRFAGKQRTNCNGANGGFLIDENGNIISTQNDEPLIF